MIDLSVPDILPKEETKHCIWCKHCRSKSICNRCLEQSRERPFWELKTEQDKKQDKPKPAKPDKLKTKPKFKRKLEGFQL